jgi:hypothetical protein
VIEEAGLDDSQTQCYQDEVLSVVLEIISDSSLTYEEQIIQIGECLSDFMEKYPDIAILIQYIEIADWGCIQDICSFGDIFLYEATVEYFEVDSESSSFESNITQALQEFVDSGTGDCGCAEEVSEFIETIESVNKRSESCEWQEGNLIGWFSVAFQIFCDEYPEIEEYLRNITIGDEGYTIGDLCDVADQQNEQNNMLSCFEDSDEDGETDVIGCLEDGIESDNSTSDEIKEEALNFTQSCQEQYESECGGDDTTCMLEVTYELFSQLSSECQSFLFSIEIQTIQIQITFYELIFNGLACSQGYACGNITEACSGETYEQMCEIGSYGDCTILDVFYEYMSNQSVVVKTQLQSYYNSIKICVNNSNPPEEKYECAKKYIDIAYTNDCDKRQDLFSTEISTVVSQEYSEEDEEFDYSYGTLGGDDSEDGFCSCSCEAACGGESSSSSSSTAASSSPIPA